MEIIACTSTDTACPTVVWAWAMHGIATPIAIAAAR
jgi:hypothetical protein